MQASRKHRCGQADELYDVFDFQVTRHREGPAKFLQGYAGYAMADRYSGNMSVILERGQAVVRWPNRWRISVG